MQFKVRMCCVDHDTQQRLAYDHDTQQKLVYDHDTQQKLVYDYDTQQKLVYTQQILVYDHDTQQKLVEHQNGIGHCKLGRWGVDRPAALFYSHHNTCSFYSRMQDVCARCAKRRQ